METLKINQINLIIKSYFLNDLILVTSYMKKVKFGKYQHYKGKFYEVISIARHSETLEELVVHKALYDSKKFGRNVLWVRPKKIFCEKVIVSGKKVPRFKFIRK